VADDVGLPGFDQVTEIGRGGFAVVYRAREVELDRVVAVKLLTGHLDETARNRFDRERRALAALSAHPNVVTIYRSGVADGRAYIVEEFAPEGSLDDRLARRGRVSWRDTADIGAKISDALAVAHDAGVLHRDVKPANILFSMYGEPMIADFGIARMAGTPATASGVVTATVVHAPPEVLDGKAPSAASDVYSLASTLYTCILGTPPFAREGDESIVPLITRVATEPPPDLRAAGAPGDVAALLERGLAKQPEYRPTAADFGHGLRSALGPGGGPGSPTTRVPPPPSPTRGAPAGAPDRRPLWIGLLGAVAVALVVAIILAVAGVFNGGPSTTTTTTSPSTTTTSPTAGLLPSGIYTDGQSGTPHYFITLTTSPNGDLRGNVSFLAQDGQTRLAFTFTGTTQSGSATLTPSTGQPISATFTDRQLALGDCTTYLEFATSNADCTFSFSASGVQ
jgi:serine/threonine protein kinase